MGITLSRYGLSSLAVFFTLLYSQKILEKPAPIPKINEVIYWNVGQGDFITYVSPFQCVVFDVGGSVRAPERLLLFLKANCPKGEAQIFISHFDKDHISNYARLIKYTRLTDAYFSHLAPRSDFGKKLLKALKNAGTNVHEIRSPFFEKLKTGSLRCLWPPPDRPLGKAENDRSLVLQLKTQSRNFIFMGDLPSKIEKKLSEVEAQILKAGHHGSKYSSGDIFLSRLKPTTCIVSVGRQNKYGHPAKEALARMTNHHCAILRTDLLGDIHFGL